jgi:hypothetical protein
VTDDELRRALREHAYLEGDFVLRSGKRSRYYLDKYRFETRPDVLEALGRRIGEAIAVHASDATRLAGPELGAVALAAAASLAAAPHPGDGKIALASLRFDSRDAAYRSPVGAVPAGTSVRIRLRTAANDVQSVRLRVYDLDAAKERFVAMKRVQRNVRCGKAKCDFWQTTVATSKPATLARPPVGRRSVTSIRTVVVFPAPLGPRKP